MPEGGLAPGQGWSPARGHRPPGAGEQEGDGEEEQLPALAARTIDAESLVEGEIVHPFAAMDDQRIDEERVVEEGVFGGRGSWLVARREGDGRATPTGDSGR